MKPPLHFVSVFALFFTLAGCEDRVPTGGFTTATATPAQSAIAATPTMTTSATVPPTAILQQQALAEARDCFAAHFLQRGDSWATYAPRSHLTRLEQWIEYNKPVFQVTPSSSAADTLNGFEYRATVTVTFTAQRHAIFVLENDQRRWGEWKDGGQLQFDVMKQRGVWKCSGLQDYTKPAVGIVPN